MDFDEYQEKAATTAKYANKGNNLAYPVLGLNGEAGEVAEKAKKIIRDHNNIKTDQHRQEIAKELGDVLWYVAAVTSEIGFSMQDVAQMNIDKLASRDKRNMIHGSGDNR